MSELSAEAEAEEANERKRLKSESPNERGTVRRMRVFGHRGASHTAPENTKASVLASLESMASGFEIDVQRTMDGRVIVLHDDTLQRTATPSAHHQENATTKSEFDRIVATNVNELKFDDIKDIDIGSWKLESFQTERVALFDEILEILAMHPDKQCLAEVKGGDVSVIPLLTSIVAAKHPSPNQLTWIGFDAKTMIATKKAMPSYRTYHILDSVDCPTSQHVFDAIDMVAEQGLDGIDFPADISIVTPEIVESAHAKGLDVAVWVSKSIPDSDSKLSWDAMRHSGVDIFTSDLPESIFSPESEVF